ncbi:MAG: hypothetical protein J5851_05865 [Oscillospiraceae bacterium]|nr:hypothetical protein [Oscillospiraceae bacterium]
MIMAFMMYKGCPLVRCGNDIYYGYMNEDYVVWLQAESPKDVDGIAVSQNVKFYLMSTDDKLNPIERVVKNGERPSLFEALDVATTWLNKANA